MHIELIGCTSAGKTTLTRGIARACARRGVEVVTNDDLVLGRARLRWVKGEFLRRRLVDVLSLAECLRTWGAHRELLAFALDASRRAPGSWTRRLNIARNALRKTGIFEIVRRSQRDGRVVLVDNEGVLQAAHNLFVHTSGPSAEADVARFVDLAPLPDAVVYVREEEATLVARTMVRGHKRVREGSAEEARRFVRAAVRVFDRLTCDPAVRQRLVLVDPHRNVTLAPESVDDAGLRQVAALVQDGVQVARNGRPCRGDATTAALVGALAESLERGCVRYCHWKSNVTLAEALSGREDLDLLVDRGDMGRATALLASLGFKPAVVRDGANVPGIHHYYGLDEPTGRLIHVHLFTGVITGESLVKSHQLPLGEMLLESASDQGGFRVCSASAELVLFVLRTFIKYGSAPDVIRLLGQRETVREELRWLRSRSRLPETLRLLEQHCPVVEAPLFLACIESLEVDRGLLRRVWLARRVRRRLRVYATRGMAARALAYVRLLWRHRVRLLTGRRRRDKVLEAGGAVIAFVGPEATGKSTLVAECGRWLGSVFAARTVHAGKPPSSWLTAPLNLLAPLFRLLLPDLRTTRLAAEASKSSEPARRGTGIGAFVSAVRAVGVAWDRRRLLLKARRASARGEIVFCDRYPSETVGAMDSPRLHEMSGAGGLAAALYDRLVGLERRLYSQIPPPDVVLRLVAPLETARQRNRERLKPGKEDDAYVEARHRNAVEWSRSGVRRVHDVDTQQPLAATLSRVRAAIWESL